MIILKRVFKYFCDQKGKRVQWKWKLSIQSLVNCGHCPNGGGVLVILHELGEGEFFLRAVFFTLYLKEEILRVEKLSHREAIIKKKFCFYGHFPYPP